MYHHLVMSIFFGIICLLPGCTDEKVYNRNKYYLKKVFFAGPVPDGRTTIFVHGTKESAISKMVHKLDYPLGIVSSNTIRLSSVLSRIALTLNEVCPAEFNQETFYYYGWHGKLNFSSRIKAAKRLYSVIKNHKGPLTIITHSHGCNVALYLAQCAEQDNNSSFTVDRLIFLAPPVQTATKHFAHSPFFKKIYTFYSSSDLMQIGDPQGLYWQSYAYTPECTPIPILSKRTFDPAPHIIQTRIFLDRQSPNHLQFLLARFIKHIPKMIELVSKKAQQDDFGKTLNNYIINIPPCGLPPQILTQCDIKRHYIPRSNYYKTKRMLARKCHQSTKTVQNQNGSNEQH